MNIPPKYEDVVAKLDAALGREAALREEIEMAKQVQETTDAIVTMVDGQRDHWIEKCGLLKQRLTVAEQRVETLTAFAQQIARQQGEPYFSKLAKAALKPAADAKSSPPCPNCKVCMGSPDFPENCLINGVKP